MWLSRDPAGFVDGPNLYAYVKQNPWTHWDPLGLKVPENRNEAESVARCMERQSKQLQKDQAARDRFVQIASDERMRGSWIHKRAEQEVARLDVSIEATAKDLDYHARSLAIYCDAAESGDADAIRHANFCENRYGKGVYAEPGLRETTSDLAEIAGAVGMARGVMSMASTVMKRFAAKETLGMGPGLEVRGLRPAPGTRVRPEGIPGTWKVRPTESGGGVQYYNPANPNQNVRVMQGNPNSPYPNSRVPYVRQQNAGGVYLRQDGTPSPLPRGGLRDGDAHIPLDQYIFRP